MFRVDELTRHDIDEEVTMADEGMVALRDALGKILASEHADLLRESVALVVREVMEVEAGEVVGAQTDWCVRSRPHGALARGYDATLVGVESLELVEIRSR